jgi:hypothetical protein
MEIVTMTNDKLNKIVSYMQALLEKLRRSRFSNGLKVGIAGLVLLAVGFNLFYFSTLYQ